MVQHVVLLIHINGPCPADVFHRLDVSKLNSIFEIAKKTLTVIVAPSKEQPFDFNACNVFFCQAYNVMGSIAYNVNGNHYFDVNVLIMDNKLSPLNNIGWLDNLCADAELVMGYSRASQNLIQDLDSFRRQGGQACFTVGTLGADDLIFSELNPVESGHLLQEQYFETVVLGGSFDHLHAGHKILLTAAAMCAKKRVICGVSDSPLLQKKQFKEFIEPLEVRIENTTHFLQMVKPGLVYEVVPIQDPFGPTIVDPDIQAIIVSDETLSGGVLVNEEREKKNMNPLKILCVSLLASQSSSKLSSTEIRQYIASGNN